MTNEAVRDLWERQRHVQLRVDCSPAERTLWDVFGMVIGSKRNFEIVLKTLPNGWGFGVDEAGISLPAGIIDDAYESGIAETDFAVECNWPGFGSVPDEADRMPVPQFLFYASAAIVFHSVHVDQELDPWSVIDRMRDACSPEVQFGLVSEEVRQAVGLEWRHWCAGERTGNRAAG